VKRGANLHIAQLMPLPLTIPCSSKSRLVLPFWYRLTRGVVDKGPLNEGIFVDTGDVQLPSIRIQKYPYLYANTNIRIVATI